jgi:ParB family transcriptional regulator, chromosome partitioning protein
VQRSKTLPKGAATFVADCLARDSYMLTQHNRDEVTAELLGIDAAAVHRAVSDLPEGSDNRASVIALALVLGSLEARTGKDAWRNPAPLRQSCRVSNPLSNSRSLNWSHHEILT